MKNVKRFLSFVLVLAMCLSLSVSAYAAPGKGSSGRIQPGNSKPQEVTEEIVIDGSAEEPEEAGEIVLEGSEFPAKTFTNYDTGLAVVVDAPEGAFPEGTTMTVSEPLFDVQGIIDASVYSGRQAVVAADISFADANGVEVQPAVPVSVSISSQVPAGNDPLVLHIADDGAVSEVPAAFAVSASASAEAFNAGAMAGSITNDTTGKVESIETISFSFVAASFSTYVLTWEVGEEEFSATIHWVTYEDGADKELDTSTTIDSTASTVDINVIIDAEKYRFIGADYKLSEDAEEYENLKDTVLKKVDGVWQINLEDSGTVAIANGSHIYVHYAVYPDTAPYVPPSTPPEDVLAPETEKTVTDNGDGTYTIRLDIEGKSDHSTTQTAANVIVVMDITQSMTNNMSGGGTRMAAAKQALNTLISTLDPNTNKIYFRAINFGDNAQPYEGVDWTTATATMQSYVEGLPNNPNDMGTCWQAGLRGAYNIVNSEVPADSDLSGNATYVIFVTDGNPNCYAANNDGSGRWTGASGPNYNATAYNRAAYWANQLGPICKFYGVYCGNSNDSGLGYLRDLITDANGSSANFIDGTSSSAIETAFADIASTIVNNLGAGGVTVDDGVPSLSNVSANVTAGEAGGFKYYIKPADGEETEWEDAPGATYSQSNGVTWDLSQAGELVNGTIYSLEFTVWPSQEAYDLIADLNNGIKDFDDLTEEEQAAVQGNKDDGYTLLTNTHLYTTFTDLDGNTYREVNDASAKAMPLPTGTIKIQKNWNNDLDGRTSQPVTLIVTKDGEEYLGPNVNSTTDTTVNSGNNWTVDNIYISMGNMSVKGSGEDAEVTINETGYDYTVIEPENLAYYWEISADIYHPMVINGKPRMLIYDEDLTKADNSTSYEIDGKIYKVQEGESLIEANNDRRSSLNFTKVITGDNAPEDTLFTFKVTITDPKEEDIWFSAQDADGNLVKDLETSATAEEGDTGYFYVASGTTFTVQIEAGWNVRVLNLLSGTEFSIEETDLNEFFKFDKAEGTADPASFEDSENEDWCEAKDAVVTGKITEPNHAFTVTYTNKFEAFYVYHSGVAKDGNLQTFALPGEGKTFNIAELATEGTLYGGYYLDYAGKGDYADDGVKGTTGVIYDGMNYEWSSPETTDGTAMTPEAGETYYIKEVPTYYLRNYHQLVFVKNTGALTGLYLLSAIDDLNYDETGFVVVKENEEAKVVTALTYKNQVTGKSVTLKADTIFKSLGITESGEYLTYFDATDDYMVEGSFTVKPYWVTPDGITVKGISERTITIDSLTKTGVSKTDA